MKATYCEFKTWWEAKTGSSRVNATTIERFIFQRLEGWSAAPPIDPSIFARRLGCHVTIEDIPAGRLEITAKEARIRIPRTQPSYMQRFSVAHELAHLMLLDFDETGARRSFRWTPNGSDSGQSRYIERTKLETLCDRIAKVMLVPSERLNGATSRATPLSLHSLGALVEKFNVPMSVIFDRMAECNHISHYPGQVLLRFGVNAVTAVEEKWRIAAKAIPEGVFERNFPKVNQSLNTLCVDLPLPSDIDDHFVGRSFSFFIARKLWVMHIRHFQKHPTPWILAEVELSSRKLRNTQCELGMGEPASNLDGSH